MPGKGSRTREKIIEKAMQLFSVKGYFNTSTRDILAATGLTKGGLYGHFVSKEEIWYAVYDRAAQIWKDVVLKNTREIADPVKRLEKTIESDMQDYLGKEVFDGGCFFFNMLVELSGQSEAMSRYVLDGYEGFSELLHSWLTEAEEKGILKHGLDLREVADFIIIALNGAAPLYAAKRDPEVWRHTLSQLRFYINHLKK